MPSRNVEGRIIKWRICQDKRVNSLDDPWAMLAYTWMIPSADNLGRLEGDPDLLASMIFPRQRHIITAERMAEILQALHDAGLIFWYEVNGERYVQFPPESWNRHQKIVGNMSRESDFPDPPEEEFRAWYEHVRSRSNAYERVHTRSDHVQTRSPEGKGREKEGKGREREGERGSPNGDPQAPADADAPSPNSELSPKRVAELWNEICGDVLPKCEKLTRKRVTHIRARLAESAERRTEEWWRAYFARIRASPFCCGDNPRGWRATIDFAVRSEDVVVSVLEGKYDARPRTKPPPRADGEYRPYYRLLTGEGDPP